jgi:stage III sporulation protein AD
MNVFSVAVIGVVTALLALGMKEMKGEYSTYLTFGAGLLIFFYSVYKLKDIVGVLSRIQDYLNMNSAYLTILLKIVGITYVSELASGVCQDAGYGSLSGQIELFGKLAVLGVSLPIVLSLLELINGFLAAGR